MALPDGRGGNSAGHLQHHRPAPRPAVFVRRPHRHPVRARLQVAGSLVCQIWLDFPASTQDFLMHGAAHRLPPRTDPPFHLRPAPATDCRRSKPRPSTAARHRTHSPPAASTPADRRRSGRPAGRRGDIRRTLPCPSHAPGCPASAASARAPDHAPAPKSSCSPRHPTDKIWKPFGEPSDCSAIGMPRASNGPDHQLPDTAARMW